MTFIRQLIIVVFFVGLWMSLVSASEKMPYRHIGAIGAEKSFAEEYNGPLSPVLFYMYYTHDEQSGFFNKLHLTTSEASYKIGIEKDNIVFGIEPRFGHTIYGAYREYDRGQDQERATYKGNYSGIGFFFQYYWSTFFSTKVAYSPEYYFYSEKDETEVNLPENHWEHAPGVELVFSTVTYESLGRIKKGIQCSLQYFYTHRTGYGSFADENTSEISNIHNSQKVYATLGAYAVFYKSVNLQCEVLSAWHHNVDRNNAEKIGSYVADYATMPGYYFDEFHHDRFVITKLQLGFPLGFWQSRVSPGFNLLYMPKENKVVGSRDYPQAFYKSVSLSTSMFLLNTVPLFVDYAYGIDADRHQEHSTEEHKGNHELQAYIVVAFGKI